MSMPTPVKTITFQISGIAPAANLPETLNRLLQKIIDTIVHLEEAYNNLVTAYNKGIDLQTIQDRVDFETSLRRIRKYVKNMHTFARRKVRVYTEE